MSVIDRTARGLGTVVLAAAIAAQVVTSVTPVLAAEDEPKTATSDALLKAMEAIVGVRAEIPPDARTARGLGTERQGSGVVIDNQGLVLTIGYLILEASAIKIDVQNGGAVAATFVGYDHNSGFGLARAVKPIDVPPLRLGESVTMTEGQPALAVSYWGPRPVAPVFVASRRDFAGYWEYLLEDAIFTSPPHNTFGGAALIGTDGRLVGIGSLVVNDAKAPSVHSPGNMFVPVDRLKPVLADLLERGRPASPAHPWLGAFTAETHGRVFVTMVASGGPAEEAGLKSGDIIVGIGGKRVRDMADLFRKAWARGSAGVDIPVDVLRMENTNLEVETIVVRSRDRYDWLKLRRGL